MSRSYLFAATMSVLLAFAGAAHAQPIPIALPGDVIIYQSTPDRSNVYPNAATSNYRPRFYRPEFYRPDYNGRAFPRYPYNVRQWGPAPRQLPYPPAY